MMSGAGGVPALYSVSQLAAVTPVAPSRLHALSGGHAVLEILIVRHVPQHDLQHGTRQALVQGRENQEHEDQAEIGYTLNRVLCCLLVSMPDPVQVANCKAVL